MYLSRMVDRMVPSPLIDADGSLVPCSCKFAAVCALAGDQTACSSYECVSHAPVVHLVSFVVITE